MSTPSTITQTLPHTHTAHYAYSTGQPYQTSPHRYASNNPTFNASSRLAHSYNSFPNNTPASITRNSSQHSSSRQLQTHNMPTSQAASALQNPRKRERSRGPDWADFYRNGPPKEIIVIDDDTPPPASKMASRRMENERPTHNTRTAARDDSDEHAAKKRRMGQGNAFQPEHFHQPAYSYYNGSHDGSSGPNSASTDRTTSLQTTAPTSLGSHTSHGSAHAYLDDAVIGQKRKRVTRQQVADEKRKKDIEIVGEAYASYVPPEKPITKAKEVNVPQVQDVGFLLDYMVMRLIRVQIATRGQNIDDDDGHYVVMPEAQLGNRCRLETSC